MAGFLDRLGRLCARRHWLVIGTWVVLATVIVVFARASSGHTFDNFRIPGAESQKMFGLGLAVAVAVDSPIVRMVLVPSLMEILGKANRWFPAWLGRLLPKITIE